MSGPEQRGGQSPSNLNASFSPSLQSGMVAPNNSIAFLSSPMRGPDINPPVTEEQLAEKLLQMAFNNVVSNPPSSEAKNMAMARDFFDEFSKAHGGVVELSSLLSIISISDAENAPLQKLNSKGLLSFEQFLELVESLAAARSQSSP